MEIIGRKNIFPEIWISQSKSSMLLDFQGLPGLNALRPTKFSNPKSMWFKTTQKQEVKFLVQNFILFPLNFVSNNFVSFLNFVSLFSSSENETKLRRRVFFQFSEHKIVKYSKNETFEHEKTCQINSLSVVQKHF